MSPGPPESPQERPAGVTTPPVGSEHGSNALGHASGAFPPMWWSPSEEQWYAELPTEGLMAFGSLGSLADSLPKDAQRLVPVGPLLDLIRRWKEARDRLRTGGDAVMAAVFDQHADLLSSLLGESPEPEAQENSHG